MSCVCRQTGFEIARCLCDLMPHTSLRPAGKYSLCLLTYRQATETFLLIFGHQPHQRWPLCLPWASRCSWCTFADCACSVTRYILQEDPYSPLFFTMRVARQRRVFDACGQTRSCDWSPLFQGCHDCQRSATRWLPAGGRGPKTDVLFSWRQEHSLLERGVEYCAPYTPTLHRAYAATRLQDRAQIPDMQPLKLKSNKAWHLW